LESGETNFFSFVSYAIQSKISKPKSQRTRKAIKKKLAPFSRFNDSNKEASFSYDKINSMKQAKAK